VFAAGRGAATYSGERGRFVDVLGGALHQWHPSMPMHRSESRTSPWSLVFGPKHVVGADGMMHVRALPAVKYDQPAARIWPHDVMLSLDAPRQKRNVERVTPPPVGGCSLGRMRLVSRLGRATVGVAATRVVGSPS
jgi:hypothetical protein